MEIFSKVNEATYDNKNEILESFWNNYNFIIRGI